MTPYSRYIPNFSEEYPVSIIAYSNREDGPGSSVGIATGYGLDGSRIEFRWGRDFPHLSIPTLGPTQRPVKWHRVFPGGK